MLWIHTNNITVKAADNEEVKLVCDDDCAKQFFTTKNIDPDSGKNKCQGIGREKGEEKVCPSVIGTDQDNVTIKGLDIESKYGTGISIWPNKGIRSITGVGVRNNKIHGCSLDGIAVGRDNEYVSFNNITIDGNELYENVQENKYHNFGKYGGWGVALTTINVECEGAGCFAVEVRNNYIHNNYGEGIGIVRSKNIDVIGNRLHDNYSVNLYINSSVHTRHEANVVYSTDKNYCRDFDLLGNELPAEGVSIANKWIDSNNTTVYCSNDNPPKRCEDASDNVIVNNFVHK